MLISLSILCVTISSTTLRDGKRFEDPNTYDTINIYVDICSVYTETSTRDSRLGCRLNKDVRTISLGLIILFLKPKSR